MSLQPKIGLITMEGRPAWEVDDEPLRVALKELGASIAEPIWSDATVDWSQFDACLIRTTWDYTERHDEYVKWADRCAEATQLFNGPKTIRWNTDKSYLRQLEKLGAKLAPTHWVETLSDFSIAEVERFLSGRKGFLKPLVGACASDTLPFACEPTGLREAADHVEANLSKSAMMLQPFLSSVTTEGELSFLYFDGAFSHAVRKIPVPGDYRVMDDFGAKDERYEPQSGERETCAEILSLLDRVPEIEGEPLLYARLDFLRDDDGALCLNELELVEPSLFFRHDPESASRLARALLSRRAT